MKLRQDELEKWGRVWIRDAVPPKDLKLLTEQTAGHTKPGARLSICETLQPVLGPDSPLTQLAQQILPGARPVRIVSFNKTANRNWGVPWHQDRVIAVRDKCHLAGFKSWSKKSRFWHVEPPSSFIGSMIFARIHLDEETTETGGLELALGSHHAGIITATQAGSRAKGFDCEACEAKPGDVVFIKALTLHRSTPSKSHALRRTLRVDYCAEDLPPPLQWAL